MEFSTETQIIPTLTKGEYTYVLCISETDIELAYSLHPGSFSESIPGHTCWIKQREREIESCNPFNVWKVFKIPTKDMSALDLDKWSGLPTKGTLVYRGSKENCTKYIMSQVSEDAQVEDSVCLGCNPVAVYRGSKENCTKYIRKGWVHRLFGRLMTKGSL